MKKLALTLTLLSGLTLSSVAPLQAMQSTAQQKQASPRLVSILRKKYIDKQPLEANEQEYLNTVKRVVGLSGLVLLLVGSLGGAGWFLYEMGKSLDDRLSYDERLEAAGFVFQDEEQRELLRSFLHDVWNNGYNPREVLLGKAHLSSGKGFLQYLSGEEKKEKAKQYRRLYFEIAKNPEFLRAIQGGLDGGWTHKHPRGLPKLRPSPDGDAYELYYAAD